MNASRSNVTGKKIMCADRSSSVSNQADSLCSVTKHKDCELRKKAEIGFAALVTTGTGTKALTDVNVVLVQRFKDTERNR